jgi:hypothetical protein
MSGVKVYSYGFCYLSACAPLDVPAHDVEQAANESHPTGIKSQWTVAPEAFKDGEANPHPCETAEGRQHWLLAC